MNSFPCSPVSQFRPGIWPNVNHVPPHHVGSQALSHNSRSQQHPPQPANFQGITNKKEENGKDSSLKKEYSCDACQKEFTSKETLNAHVGSHIQCNHEGCTFKASRKILKLHWIQVHASGKMRIKLDTPEEIAKWREERKRKYPTLANVEKKKEEEAKRRASGQILKTKNFRYVQNITCHKLIKAVDVKVIHFAKFNKTDLHNLLIPKSENITLIFS